MSMSCAKKNKYEKYQAILDASMSCESNEHPVDLCIIIMLFLLCPCSSSTDPGIRQFQELHAGGAVGGVEGGHL